MGEFVPPRATSPLRLLAIATSLLATSSLVAMLGVRLAQRSYSGAMYFVPTEADVLRSFPGVKLAGGAYKGVWGERDRGTWIFQYGGLNGAAAVDALGTQLLTAGWRPAGGAGNERRFLLSRGHSRVHLLAREHADRVEVMVVIGEGDDPERDPFVKRVIERRWREREASSGG